MKINVLFLIFEKTNLVVDMRFANTVQIIDVVLGIGSSTFLRHDVVRVVVEPVPAPCLW